MAKVEELVGCPVRHHVGVHIDNLAELCLPPKVDLGEGRVEVPTAHKVEIRGVCIPDATGRNHIVVDGLELRNDINRDRVQGDQDGQLLGGARIAERVRQH
jgi:hypothetical protein